MKLRKNTKLLMATIAVFIAAVSCNKIVRPTFDPKPAGKVEICITGDFNDFDGLDTKATIENVFRMTWAEGTGDPKVYDKVYVFGKASGASVFSCLGTLDAEPDSSTGNRVADLKGTITAPETGTNLTLVHSPVLTSAPAVTDGAIKIDLSKQGGKADSVVFVAYAYVDYKGTTDATYRTSFSFATSVLRVNVTNLSASAELTQATIQTIETSCKLAFATDAAPTVTGDKSLGTITRTFSSCSSNAKGTTAFYIAVPAITANAGRSLTVIQSGNEYSANGFAAGQKSAGNIMNSIAELYTNWQHGFLNGQEFVVIKGSNDKYLKWATQNLAVTESGKAKWISTDYQIGDYFQWAAYDGYVSGTKPENLVLYTSFTNDGSSGSFSGLKDGKQFYQASAPYGGGSYTKYTGISGDGKIFLELTDDVANIVLGSTWRMPTGGHNCEFKCMKDVTYWAWDGTDKGYYVFMPGVGTSGKAGDYGTYGSGDDKTKALLFFPATGYGGTDGGKSVLNCAGLEGCYWSNTLYPADNTRAYDMLFSYYSLNVETNNLLREEGFPIRPVAD